MGSEIEQSRVIVKTLREYNHAECSDVCSLVMVGFIVLVFRFRPVLQPDQPIVSVLLKDE